MLKFQANCLVLKHQIGGDEVKLRTGLGLSTVGEQEYDTKC